MAVGVRNLRFKPPPEKESSLQERKQLQITLYLKLPFGKFNTEKKIAKDETVGSK